MYNNQSTAMIKKTSLAGSRTVSNTITIVTNPACGIPAAPILAAVAVILKRRKYKRVKNISFSIRRKKLN